MDGMQNLCNAIVMQAAKDYRANVGRLRKRPEDSMARADIRELKQFFCSSWFTVLSDADGNYILQRLRKEAA